MVSIPVGSTILLYLMTGRRMTDLNMFLVGGAVRDLYRDKKSKDWDFAVEAESYEHMRDWLVENGFQIFADTPKYFTLRARAEHDRFQFGTLDLTRTTFDFTLCRKERDYTDGRHPDVVEAGTIYDDLSRRDFTMNAIALDKHGRTIDPFDGVEDIQSNLIRCVGGVERLEEDGLRIMRAMRFYAQLGFDLDGEIVEFINSGRAVEALKPISVDRIREELGKALRIDSVATLDLLQTFPNVTNLIFGEKGIWLEPTSAKR